MTNSIKFIAMIFITMAMLSCKKENKVETAINNQPEDSTQAGTLALLAAATINSPNLIYSTSTLPKGAPAIFYTPHQDDETLGMGASIAEHVRAGKAVFVVLLSNGENDLMLTQIRLKYNSKATMQDVINARNNEMIAACQTLGVHRVYIANSGLGFPEKNITRATLIKQFKATMDYMRKWYPNAAHKTISGNCDSHTTSCGKHDTHRAAATAIHELYNAGAIKDIRLYRVYIYYGVAGKCDRNVSWLKPVDPRDKAKRQAAIEQYKSKNASKKRYGLGYFSVPQLFDKSLNSNYEYVDFIQNDY